MSLWTSIYAWREGWGLIFFPSVCVGKMQARSLMGAAQVPAKAQALSGSWRSSLLKAPTEAVPSVWKALLSSWPTLQPESPSLSSWFIPAPLSHYTQIEASIMLTIKLLLLCLCDDWFNKCPLCQMRHTSSLSHSCVPRSRRLLSIHLCQHSPSLLQALPNVTLPM